MSNATPQSVAVIVLAVAWIMGFCKWFLWPILRDVPRDLKGPWL